MDVQRKEEEAERYRASSGLLSTQGVLFTEQQTSEIQGSMLQARADLAEKEAQYRQLQQVIQKRRQRRYDRGRAELASDRAIARP